ncbi:MAG: glycosyltransferase family 1 protein [Bacteroidota bacterium]
MSNLVLFFRKRYPTAFSIERLFEQLSSVFTEKGTEVKSEELPLYNNSLSNVWRNLRWARARVQKGVEKPARVSHITGDVNSIIFGLSGPTVITIHDCNPLLRYAPSHPRYWFYRWLIFEWPARKAAAVTVISEKTRSELLELTNCPADKIRVIPNFVDPSFTYQPRTFNESYPTILQIGVKQNKNLARLAQALKGIPCRLEIVGQPSPEDEAELIRNEIDFHWTSGISDEEIRRRYTDCDLLAFVSTYEGFGLPILEAQMTGRPVVTSDLSPHKEVAAPGGAELVDPTNVTSIRTGILNVIRSATHREALIKSGRENAQRYHIQTVASQYLDLYEELS